MKFLLIFLLISGCKSIDAPDKKTVSEIHPDDIAEVGFFQTAPDKLGEWYSTPDISICESSAVTRSQVESASEWWEERGYEFDGIYDGTNCWRYLDQGQFMYGTILIRMPSQTYSYDFTNYGTTIIFHQDNMILGAIIEISNPRERVVEHELGHALGWLHYSKRNHLMHPYWSRGGWNDDSLAIVNIDLSIQPLQAN